MTGNGYDCTGTIPGSLYSFLLDNKLMDDPYYRDNEFGALELTYHEYTFTRTFNFEKDECEHYVVCEGLDTFCDVYLNGKHIGKADNMHVTYSFDATEAIKNGENEITVVCHPIREFLKEKNDKLQLFPSTQSIYGFGHIRKAHCMLGWDWGPMLPDTGIWRPIYVESRNSAKITDIKINQRHEGGRVFITPSIKTDKEADVKVTLICECGCEFGIKANEEYEVENPRLWWPAGLGKQSLYTVKAEVIEGGEVVHTEQRRIGLRDMKLIREKDKWGESFMHECNGVRFFAMGADYIPEDNVLSRCTKERSYTLLKRCKDANFNAIRIWGGGYYPDDYFFDICDELGLVVFFDLAFACSLYNPDDEMLESIRVEVRQNISRLRHHPSIALISGNNEVEACSGGAIPEVLAACKDRICEMFNDTIPTVLKEVYPEIPYISTSPICCGHFIEPNNDNYGDTHYWEVWHSGKPFTEYRNHYFRYLSEFGFQSFPCEKTVNQFTLPEDRNIFSRVMEQHQRNTGANAKIVTYLSETFLYPTNFGTLLYASQLLQAEAIKYGVEHLRRNRGRCMGALYWQLNDIWPVASWASIDYYGRLKALHYYAKRFFTPVIISCEEIGEKATRPFVIYDPYEFDYVTKAKLSVTNDTLADKDLTVRAYLRNSYGKVLETYEWNINVPSFSVVHLDQIDFNKTDVKENYYSYELVEAGEIISSGTVLFTAPKHFEFKDPEIEVKVEGDEITVKASAYAKSVELYSDDEDFVLSDNFFDINGDEVRVKVLEGKTINVKARSVYDIR